MQVNPLGKNLGHSFEITNIWDMQSFYSIIGGFVLIAVLGQFMR